ncbi:hypothetical protein OMW55_02770 [Sphingomonas sp. BN140010]|uniref:Replication protein A n=1 Tax=Sphingomonas arvum TaxID=2992113 RepID=A0ABT3JCD0_9SPHN|nr:hypothetical protein [Sphingomonas sp. BN140010]MCW3796730.1 hypothetical protein [Sphingomonas sp. BN140010]
MASLPLPYAPTQPARYVHSAAPTIVPVEAAGSAPAPARLSPLEWSIVAMAERDNLASLREPGRIAAALESLFGLTRANRLAHPRLEALRRVAVHAWRHHWNVPSSELKAFVAEGFTLDQYELIQASISRSRESAPRRRRLGR